MAQIVFDLQRNVDLLSGSTFKAWQGTKNKNIAQEQVGDFAQHLFISMISSLPKNSMLQMV